LKVSTTHSYGLSSFSVVLHTLSTLILKAAIISYLQNVNVGFSSHAIVAAPLITAGIAESPTETPPAQKQGLLTARLSFLVLLVISSYITLASKAPLIRKVL